MAQKTMWIDAQPGFEPAYLNTGGPNACAGFLIEVSPQGRETYYQLRTEPGRKNVSREACLEGWLGETNNVNSYARGVWAVIKYADHNPNRIKIGALDGDDLADALEGLGYPDLAVD